jgi:DNA-binding NarL/FixJ family response regulator
MPGLRLLLVDDQPVIREGLRRIIDPIRRGWTLLEASSAEEALQRLVTHEVDMVVTELSLPGAGGLALIRQMRAQYPKVAVLVLSVHTEAPYPLRCIEAGARGYVAKDSLTPEIVDAVERIASGGAYLSAGLAGGLLSGLHGSQPSPDTTPLSAREQEVRRRLVAGERPVDIAESMALSVKTVSTHKARLLAKLGLPSLCDLIRHDIDRPT